MDNTYVVYCEEYYFSMNTFSTILKKRVYNVSYNQESAEEVKSMMEEIMQKNVDLSEINANNEMLTTYDIKIVCLEGKYSLDEAKAIVINNDYTWGKTGKSR
jgi:saccharopine dehydrogenase-like NADP-dependent oxidoreductase